MPLKPTKGDCDQCQESNVWIGKNSGSSGSWCLSCLSSRKERPKKKSTLNKVRKPTGEKALFEALWNTRNRRSYVTGRPLGNEARVHFFSHILPKGAYPKFRLFDRNIQFMTLEEHTMWENYKYKIKDDPKWKHVFELEQELKELYHR